jgi:Ca2+-binding RTX toxin-like protein
MPRIEFRGGDGNDQLFGGSGADSLLGGPGADTLVGGGDDNLLGDAGNDKVIGGPGDDTVSLGADSDQFTWNPAMSHSDIGVVRVDLGPPSDPRQNRGHDNAAGFTGTDGADRIRISGTPAAGAAVTGLGPTVVLTRAQTLSVVGRGGDDILDASGPAAGTVGVLEEAGQNGNDTLIGSPGRDQLFGRTSCVRTPLQ